jgi:predicted Zn-dependent protease
MHEPVTVPAAEPLPPRRSGRRRWSRVLAVVLLLALIALGAWLIGVQLWGLSHFGAARAAVERGHNAAAREHLQACLRLWPHDPTCLLLAARTAWRSNTFEEAQTILELYARSHGKDDNYLLEWSLLHAARGDAADVSKFCQAHVDQDLPDAPLILEALTQGYLLNFQVGAAERTLKLWQQRQPDSALVYLYLGRLADARQGQDEARKDFRRALELDPDLVEARHRLAALLLDLGQAEEALPHIDYLVRHRPEAPLYRVYLARCRDLLGQQDEAEKLLDELLARQPHYAPALAFRGALAWRSDQPEVAEPLLREAVRLEPNDAATFYQLARCLTRLGKPDEAREAERSSERLKEDVRRFGEILAQDARTADLRYEAGMIALRAGEFRDAVRWFERALKLDPRHAEAHRMLATCYQQTGELARALHHRELAEAAQKERPPSK